MIIKGLIQEWTSDFDQVAINGDILGDQWDWEDFTGKVVHLRYFISEAPIESLEDAIEGQIRTFYGALEADGYPVCGSEWTGQYAYEQEFVIGGHDLLEELRSHVGQYVLIEVRLDEL